VVSVGELSHGFMTFLPKIIADNNYNLGNFVVLC